MFIVTGPDASTVLSVSFKDLSSGLQRLGTNGLAGWGRCSTFGDGHAELGGVHRVHGVGMHWQMSSGVW